MKPSMLNQGPSNKWASYAIMFAGVISLLMDIPVILLPFLPPFSWNDIVSFGIGLYIFVIGLFLGLGLLFVFLGRYLLYISNLLARREAKRRRIMQGAAIDLLTQPSQSSQPTFMLPFSIKLRSPVLFRIVTVFLSILQLGVLVLEILGGADFVVLMGIALQTLFVLFLDLMLLGTMGWIINEEGISYKTPIGIFYRMKWSAIRSVALAGPRTHTLPIEFEVADEHFPITIFWRRLPPVGFVQRWRYRSSLPTETYNQQIGNILAYVLDRTGLPLHDIRDD